MIYAIENLRSALVKYKNQMLTAIREEMQSQGDKVSGGTPDGVPVVFLLLNASNVRKYSI